MCQHDGEASEQPTTLLVNAPFTYLAER